jgi:hypothetical protein
MNSVEINDQRADLVRKGMVAFAQDVMNIQLRRVNREETDYNLFAFDWACDGFLVGALMTIAETTPLPTPPKEVAFMGLIAYLTEIRGVKFERARERTALLYNAPEGSKAALLFEAGQHHWKNPDALKIYFRTQQPGETESQKWTDAMQRQKKYIVYGGIAALITIVIVIAYIMHM